jgi:hypothetical protein
MPLRATSEMKKSDLVGCYKTSVFMRRVSLGSLTWTLADSAVFLASPRVCCNKSYKLQDFYPIGQDAYQKNSYFHVDLLLKILISKRGGRSEKERRKKSIKTLHDGYKDQKCIAARRKQLLELNTEWFLAIPSRLNHIE